MRASHALGIALAALLAPSAASAQSQPAPSASASLAHGSSHVIVQLRASLARWMTAEEVARLDAVDASDTFGADATQLAYLAADRALRRFAPMALDAVARGRDATHLRSLARLADAPSVDAVARDPVVQRAARRRSRLDVASTESLARVMIACGPATPSSPVDPTERDARSRAADRAVLAAVDAARYRDMDEVASAVHAVIEAYDNADADRALVVDAAVDLLRELADAGRALPAPTVPQITGPLALDPFAPEPSPAPVRHGPRHRAVRPSSPPTRSPSGPCMDDLRCMPP